MKTIILFFLLTTLSFSQNFFLLMDGNSFKPTDDPNLVLWLENPNSTTIWQDSSGNNYDITLNNAPTLNAAGKNGKSTLTFNGTDESGQGTFTLTQPYVVIIAIKQVSWTMSDRIYDGKNINTARFYQTVATPNMAAASVTSINVTPQLSIDTWGIITTLWKSTDSYVRLNENSKATGGDLGTSAAGGITLAATGTLGNNGNIEYGAMIITKSTDDATVQKHIRYLNKLLSIY